MCVAQASKYARNLERLQPVLEKYLQEGVLKEEFVLDSIPKLMNTMREANVTLRWLMLHNCALTPGKLCVGLHPQGNEHLCDCTVALCWRMLHNCALTPGKLCAGHHPQGNEHLRDCTVTLHWLMLHNCALTPGKLMCWIPSPS